MTYQPPQRLKKALGKQDFSRHRNTAKGDLSDVAFDIPFCVRSRLEQNRVARN
jgi:hypothetical protein